MADDLNARLDEIVTGAMAKFYGPAIEPGPGALVPYRVDFAELFAMEVTETDWLVEPVLARGRGHALYAGAKTGKSLFVLELSAALAVGRTVLARAAGEPVGVLYLDFEMTMADLRERLEAFGYGPDDIGALNANLHYMMLPSIPPLDTAAGGAIIAQAAKDLDVALVVIDTTARAVAGDENDADTYRALYRHCGQLLKEADIAFIRLDHAGKDLDRGQRGSSAKNDDVDVVWQMVKRDGGYKLTATHRRLSWVPIEVDVLLDEDTMTGTIAHKVVERPVLPEGTQRLVDMLDAMEAPVDIAKRTARALLLNAGERCRDVTLLAALKHRKSGSGATLSTAISQLMGTNGSHPSETPGQGSEPVAEPAGATPPSRGSLAAPTRSGSQGATTQRNDYPQTRRDLY